VIPHSSPPAPPVIVSVGPYQASFGLIAGRVGRRATRIVVRVDGRIRAARKPRDGRFSFYLRLPPRDVAIRVTALGAEGHAASSTVRPVLGLPPAAAPRLVRAYRDPKLSQLVTHLTRQFPGIAGAYVQDLRTGAGAAWNARARFPAASTLKLAIAVEVLRMLGGRPPARGSGIGQLMDAMLIHSDNESANELLVSIGGSTGSGGAVVDETLRALGLTDTEMYGGYIRGTAGRRRRGIPIRLTSQPSFGLGKYTTAWDLARLIRYVELAAGGTGPLARRFPSFTPADGRYLLYELGHVQEPGRLGRFFPSSIRVAHKAGWISTARHDNGLVFWRRGSFVVTVMTWRPGGAGASSDLLAGRIAQVALRRFVRLAPR
jgi:Beta-lactamase enzyme family